MGQVIIRGCSFLLIVMVGAIGGWGNPALAQEDVIMPKILNAGDSLLIKELYFKGVQQRSSGQLAAAENTFGRLALLQPDSDAIHFELARIHLERADYVAAERAAKRATELDPDNEWYWSTLLDIFQKKQRLKEMPAVFDQLIRLNPTKAAYYHDKAYALYADKQFDAALAVYDTIAEKFGAADDQYLTKYQIYLAQGDRRAAINELQMLISRKPQESQGYILLAELYTEGKESKKALALLDNAAELFPDEPLVLLGKSDTYLAMGKQNMAYSYLRQAFMSEDLGLDAKAGILYTAISGRKHRIEPRMLAELANLLAERHPGEAKAHAVKGDIFTQLHQLEQGRQAYQDAIGINQYIDGIWQQLLQVELQLGRYDDVEIHGKEALALFANHPLILFFTGHGYLGNKKYQEARKHMESALNNAGEEHIPLLTQVYSSLGDIYHALSMFAESDVAYEEAIALDSTNAYALNNYAYYLALRKEKLPLAAEMSKKSIELTPDYASYEDTYAWVLFQQGKYDDALKWIKKAIKNSGDPSETLLEHYGDILAMLGNIKEALVQWKKAKNILESTGKDIDRLSKKINAKQYIE
ncbi:tetratricopeptide repeat protein [Parapedobacter deserti]|uniref:Tetratricopeptide repeat protein n=1 Tax=Parapedobacter deserti TaxID=1912957 RepID=A0ABV7JQ47_9SPHI